MRLQVTLERKRLVTSEIQWRGVQRDATVIFAFTLMGVALGSIGTLGTWVMVTALPLTYLGSIWLHHDRRIGSLAEYMRIWLDPALERYDRIVGLDEFLDEYERSRTYGQRFHFTAVMSRLMFPSLQGIGLAAGLGLFVARGPYPTLPTVLVVVATALVLYAIVLTFAKVKHERPRPA